MCCVLNKLLIDILLNVFLAIAVDNLADAESLTAIEKEEEAAEAEQGKSKSPTPTNDEEIDMEEHSVEEEEIEDGAYESEM